MKYVSTIALILLLNMPVVFPGTTQAQSTKTPAEIEIAISRRAINDKRNQTIAFNMNFTKQEKADFWPLYREYRAAMTVVGDKRLAVIMDYGEHHQSISEKKARQLLDDYFAVEREELSVKQKYTRKFRRILSEIKVTRLMQIEGRIDAAVRMKLAEGIPLME